MRELKDFDISSTTVLLSWAFRVYRESAKGMNYQAAGGGNKKHSADEKALVLQEASRVVNFVDKKLPDVQRALVRFCFCDGEEVAQNRNYNALHNWAWRAITPPEDPEVRNGLSCVRVLVPYELRLRVYGMRRAFSLQQLADFLEIPKTTFHRHYQAGWLAMVEALLGERMEAFGLVDDCLQELLARRDAAERDALIVEEIARYMADDPRERIKSAGGFADERLKISC